MQYDPFSDVRGSLAGNFGTLGGEGAEAQYSCKTNNCEDRQGRQFSVLCDNCGQPNNIIINWDEFIYGMMGLVPPGWQHSPRHKAMHPNVGCRACNALMLVLFTPDECKRHLDAGVSAKSVTPAYIQNAVGKIRSTAGGPRR